MNKLWTALVAATFGLGMSAAVAQNVDSDKAKAQGQDSVMQEKEGGKANQGATSDTDRERTNRHVDQGSARPDAAKNKSKDAKTTGQGADNAKSTSGQQEETKGNTQR
jgi:hypothetical protein